MRPTDFFCFHRTTKEALCLSKPSDVWITWRVLAIRDSYSDSLLFDDRRLGEVPDGLQIESLSQLFESCAMLD
jgi:hypothetical protein